MRMSFPANVPLHKLALSCVIVAIFISPLAAQNSPTAASSNHVTLTYRGTAGWEIADGKTLVLVDPT